MFGQWVINLDGSWWVLDGDSLSAVDNLQSVIGPALVLTDFGNVTVSVDTVSGPKSYAAPLIEKQLREAGTLDRPGRVLLHASDRHGGTTRVLYSAVPAEAFADYCSQTVQRRDHCLLFSFVSALYRHAVAGARGGNAVLFRHGRQFELLVAGRHNLVGMAHATAFSTKHEDLKQAVTTLADDLRAMRGESGELPAAIQWFCFGASNDETQGLADHLTQLTGLPVEVAPERTLSTDSGEMRTSILECVAPLSSADAVNGAGNRWLYRAEHWLPAAAAAVLAVSLAFWGAAWHWTGQAHDLGSLTRAASREDAGVALRQIGASLPQPGAAVHESPPATRQHKFLSRLGVAMAAPDLRRIVKDIDDAAPPGMRIEGISFAKTPTGAAIAVDGVVQKALREAMGDLQTLSSALRAKGYRIADEDAGAMDENNSFRLTMKWEPDHAQI